MYINIYILSTQLYFNTQFLSPKVYEFAAFGNNSKISKKME